MAFCKSVSTPMTNEGDFTHKDEPETLEENYPYKAIVGSLNYISNVSRPDITFAVNKLARSSENPNKLDWIKIKRLLRYLEGSKDIKIIYCNGEKLSLELYSDSDFAGDKDRKSTSGFIAQINGALILWYSRKQKTVALSALEAEFISMASATQEGLLIQELFAFIKLNVDLKIFVDNRSCSQVADNTLVSRKGAKHIEVKYEYIKYLIAMNAVALEYV